MYTLVYYELAMSFFMSFAPDLVAGIDFASANARIIFSGMSSSFVLLDIVVAFRLCAKLAPRACNPPLKFLRVAFLVRWLLSLRKIPFAWLVSPLCRLWGPLLWKILPPLILLEPALAMTLEFRLSLISGTMVLIPKTNQDPPGHLLQYSGSRCPITLS